ncbi:LysR family transcriptional regulator [Rhodospirillum rubrum]|uniref:LysR family transcriptional regulator n=1 Tax=Rhodospirillum rubrum TaxID=1085 RepID=UPI00190302C5|nr:LysR family transcriptional regulator [Rhodospirillum rubrum]MBK1663795.1 LysR family transcriptional regulator [Rhodospirillum rubrum]MBK1675866.1 LysR family transcriptional regulator [Rhodospirillum rubrum]
MRHATLRQMQIFDAVARHLSFSNAARELGLTQPAVSLQIKQIEALAGLPLFEQMGRVLLLTQAGTILLGHVRTILAAVTDADKAMDALKGKRAGALRIGVVSTAKYFAPRLLSVFTAGYPGVELGLTVANREQILGMIQENALDLFIMGRPPTEPAVRAERFAPNPMVMVAASDHPLVRRKLTFHDLSGETFLMREPGSGTRILMEKLMTDHGVLPHRMIEMSSNETIKQAVMAGMGISLLSRNTMNLELSVGRLVILDVEGLPIQRDWYVVIREGKHLLPVAEAMVAFLKARGEDLLSDTIRSLPPRRSRHISG